MNHFVLIAHGWDLNETLDLNNYPNSLVILSRYPVCYSEPPETKHRQMMFTSKTVEEYYGKISEHLKKYGNDFCVFSSNSKEFNKVPNMLITMIAKEDEINEFYKISDEDIPRRKTTEIGIVFTLKEILDKLESDFSLLLIACRPPIDKFQIDVLSNDKKFKEVFNWIENNKIQTNEQGLILNCESFIEYLVNKSKTEK